MNVEAGWLGITSAAKTVGKLEGQRPAFHTQENVAHPTTAAARRLRLS